MAIISLSGRERPGLGPRKKPENDHCLSRLGEYRKPLTHEYLVLVKPGRVTVRAHIANTEMYVLMLGLRLGAVIISRLK